MRSHDRRASFDVAVQPWHSTTSTKQNSSPVLPPSTMEHPGLLSWANSVRLTMASDPGRQLFKDQVQMHGFLFLEDYLDNIVSGAKQEYVLSHR